MISLCHQLTWLAAHYVRKVSSTFLPRYTICMFEHVLYIVLTLTSLPVHSRMCIVHFVTHAVVFEPLHKLTVGQQYQPGKVQQCL